MRAEISSRYSVNPAENKLIWKLMEFYRWDPPRHLSMERDWDGQGIQIAARPYSRVRCVDIYDGAAWVNAGMPKDYTPFKCGIRMEAW